MTTIPTMAGRPARCRLMRPIPVSINGMAISSADIARETQHHASPDPDESWALAARALAIRELLSQEADRLNITAEPIEDGEGRRETESEARLRALLDHEVVVPSAGEAECRRYFDQNCQRFRSPDLFEAAHILIAAPPRDESARIAARALAEALIAELQQRPGDFAPLARTHSACPSSKQDGNLGQIGPGQTVAEFERALREMETGRLHPKPVETRYGVHIVRLDRRIEGREMPFEMVWQRIADYLNETVHRRALAQYVSILAARATVTGVDLGAATGPLVQ
jgi:peptidyl-prolyl cis-trans isomerase C